MPRIAAVAIATPPHLISQEKVKEFARALYGESKIFKKLLPVFDNVAVKKRHLVVDEDWLKTRHTFTETNDHYVDQALKLSEQVTLDAARLSGVKTSDFDVVFFVSTTGLSTPSIDARLFNRIALNPHIKRVPIWGLGCAAGAGALARAYDYLKAYPRHRALIIAVELCSLSFQKNEVSKTDIISAALFSDGAAACAVFGDSVSRSNGNRNQPSILGSMSTIYPDTMDVMSWRTTGDGFRVQLSRDIPTIVNSLVKQNIDEFLKDQELILDDVEHFVFHPGGAKVLKAYSDGLSLASEKLAHSYDVLRDFGNMSSSTVFFVLKRLLENGGMKTGEYGLLGALGPGFSSELVLLQGN